MKKSQKSRELPDSNLEEVAGNYFNKFQSKNFVHKILIKNYIKALVSYMKVLAPKNILDIGCGEGEIEKILKEKFNDIKITGLDKDEGVAREAKKLNREVDFVIADAGKIPFTDNRFDIGLCLEVLEHTRCLDDVLTELRRVTSRAVIISVPYEPYWRLLNLARCKYLKRLGNTPGHLNHFSKNKICNLVNKYFLIQELKTVFPWIFILARQKF
jgi:ubiquinone/menaquinone biosynthesis C-methylase UbiE